MTNTILRIHPAIGIARVGNSEAYYLAPETSAGLDQGQGKPTGGLPIKPGTEADTITDQDLRDDNGALKRQAQRFRIYQYDDAEKAASYPYTGTVNEITIGSQVDHKTVVDIIWTVHLANKKANCWLTPEIPAAGAVGGLSRYDDGQHPPIRNKAFAGTSDPGNPERLTRLVIDAGPRAIRGTDKNRITFDASTTPTYYKEGTGIQTLDNYPVSYPSDKFKKLNSPSGNVVRQLGAIETDEKGRLLVIGGEGTASGWYRDENMPEPNDPFPLSDDVNNDGWFDDTADGPVNAVLVFDDQTTQVLTSTAWAVSTDPAYAPQIRNIINLWDEVYDTWLHCFQLQEEIYSGPCNPTDASGYKQDYIPAWGDIYPIFRGAYLQQFTTGLNALGIGSHTRLDRLTPEKEPASFLHVPSLIRDPYKGGKKLQTGAPMMPLALGDTGASFLTLTKTQYFFLNQWFAHYPATIPETSLTAGEQLDKNVLTNGLGGRFSPGIDLTFIVRDPVFYNANWKNPEIGAFRINAAELNYESASENRPFLGVGYMPENEDTHVEPGDVCKFMALPWHTDYNSCATHLPSPNPGGKIEPNKPIADGRNMTLFWSWPAQRPVSVYVYKDLHANGGKLPAQRYSVRGDGTQGTANADGPSFPAENVGRFQKREDIVINWPKIGTVIQGAAIEEYTFNQDYYLEVQSHMTDVSDVVVPWPNQVTDKLHPTE